MQRQPAVAAEAYRSLTMSLLWFISIIVVVACLYAGYRIGKYVTERKLRK